MGPTFRNPSLGANSNRLQEIASMQLTIRKIAMLTIGIVGALTIVILILFVVLVLSVPRLRHMAIPETIVVELPGIQGEARYSRKGTHPFAAEYTRTIAYNNGKRHPLPYDTGCAQPLNLYRIEEGEKVYLRMVDCAGEYLFDLDADSLLLVVTRYRGHTVAGEFSSEHPHVRGTGMVLGGDPTETKVRVDGNLARPIKDIISDRHGTFLGSIEGQANRLRYWPPSERNEVQVDPAYQWGEKRRQN